MVKKGSHANSTREGSRWCREGYQSTAKKVNSSRGVRDNHQRFPQDNSSDIVTPKKRDTICSHSGRSYESHRAGVEGPSKLQKINETSKVRFLTAEEVIKRASCIEAPRSSHVGSPTDRDCVTSSRSSQIVGIASSQKSSSSAKNETQVACDGRKNSLINQHLPIQRSQSTENMEAPPGFPVKNSTLGEKPIYSGAENNFSKQVSADGKKGEGDSSLVFPEASSASDPDYALKDGPPRNTEHGKGDSRSMVDVKDEHTVAVAKPEKLEASSEKHEGGADAVMREQLKDPNRRTIVVNDPSGIKFKAGPNSDCDDGRGKNLPTNLPNALECPQNGPALKSIWKGDFEVLDLGSAVRRCEGFIAHPSAKVSSRAYDFANQITKVLQFVIHPQHDFWPEIFQNDSPDRNDIALYFYPGNYERSKQQYSSLLKLLERQDLVLRSSTGSMQLLVFPSKLLRADLQKLDGSYFMWGVFCSPKVTFRGGEGDGLKLKPRDGSTIVVQNEGPENAI